MVAGFLYERRLWKEGFRNVVGADEVGRGAFAGPVVAGAVALAPMSNVQLPIYNEKGEKIIINDSKKMTPRQRERAARWIKGNALCWGIGQASVAEINRLGMAKATRMAFRRAIAGKNADFLLIDAFYLPYTKGLRRKNQLAIVNGDEKSASIAAASIIAKVHRDRAMRTLSRKHPQYGWGKNKGYGTREHREAIKRHGVTRLHRKVFIS